MNVIPSPEADRLRHLASQFDAHRGRLPDLANPHRQPDLVLMVRQFVELSELAAETGRQILNAQGRTSREHGGLRLTRFADAAHAAAEAAAHLGGAVEQLAFLSDTRRQRTHPGYQEVRESAVAVIADELVEAQAALDGASTDLHAAASRHAPPLTMANAARARSTGAGMAPQVETILTAATFPPQPVNSAHVTRSR